MFAVIQKNKYRNTEKCKKNIENLSHILIFSLQVSGKFPLFDELLDSEVLLFQSNLHYQITDSL